MNTNKRPLNIAMVSPLFESVPPKLYGGTERVVYNLCQGLTEAGHEVTLYASGDSHTNARLISVIDKSMRLHKKDILDPTLYAIKMATLIAKHAEEYDIIHNHFDYWLFPIAHAINTPVITTVHGRIDIPNLNETYTSSKKNKFISISNHQRTPMPFLHWVKTIYHGIDLKQFKFTPTPGKYLAFLGRICPEKRPEWAIEIAKQSGVPLKIAAKIETAVDGEFYETVVRPKIDGKFIEYVGEIAEHEKSEFLGNALALVFPIDWPEPFGLVMIEALATGTPVLARPCGSVKEILKDGHTGFLDHNLSTLASRVHDLNRIQRIDCRQWVEKKFSLPQMIQNYIEVYDMYSLFQTQNKKDSLFLQQAL